MFHNENLIVALSLHKCIKFNAEAIEVVIDAHALVFVLERSGIVVCALIRAAVGVLLSINMLIHCENERIYAIIWNLI